MPRLFGTSGVRGVINAEVTPKLASKLGLAVSRLVGGKKIAVARDTRRSGIMLLSGLLSGIMAGGSDAVNLGIVPTPVLAFLTHALGHDAGAMITASHNPPEYNGIKLFDEAGMAYGPIQQSKMEETVESGWEGMVGWNQVGGIVEADETGRYIEMICGKVQLTKNWNIVVDLGCGAACFLAPELLRLLGCHVTSLNSQPDGFFPGRTPEPSPEALAPLSMLVKAKGADIGIAYDGDADRVSFVDERGSFASFDRSLAAMASYSLRRSGGGTIVTPIDASMSMDDIAVRENGKVVRTPVGDVEVARAIKERGAIFGGEPCGAWIFPEFHMCPDGILSSIMFLDAIETENVSASTFLSRVPEYPVLRSKVNCPSNDTSRIMSRLKERLPPRFREKVEVLTLDGIKVFTSDWWLLVRSSGTEPTIRITAEAKTQKKAEDLLELGLSDVSNTVREICN